MRSSLLRVCSLSIFVLFSSVLALQPARAATIAFDVLLTPLPGFGPTGGTGSFSVTGPINPNFQDFSTSTGLLSLSFSIGGQNNFTLANSQGNEHVTFLSGNLFGLLYNGSVIGQSLFLNLASAGLQYSYADIFHPEFNTTGTISASVHVSAVPGPIVGAGLPGLLAGCAALFAYFRRRSTNRNAVNPA